MLRRIFRYLIFQLYTVYLLDSSFVNNLGDFKDGVGWGASKELYKIFLILVES